MHTDIERILYDESQIAAAVKRLGAEITADFAGKNPLLLCILKGSSIFHADLVRAIDLPCGLEYITAKSYGMSASSSGNVKIAGELNVTGRDVIIVEDILDTALTLTSLVHTLSGKQPASIKTAVLLDKDLGIEKPLEADYKGFDVPNEFLVGYGLDYAEKYRNLPYIGILKREIYQ
jgi:hypoxanthine phosphoribosyltransferase